MDKYTLWICVVGGNNDDERILYEGNSAKELEETIFDNSEEVIHDADKYFLLNDTTFYSYRDYCDLLQRGIF